MKLMILIHRLLDNIGSILESISSAVFMEYKFHMWQLLLLFLRKEKKVLFFVLFFVTDCSAFPYTCAKKEASVHCTTLPDCW